MDSIAHLAFVTVLLVGCGGGDLAGEPPSNGADVAVEDSATPDDTGGSSDTSAIDAPSAGRTMLSCDDGRTWIKNHSDDDSIRCFEGISPRPPASDRELRRSASCLYSG